MSQRGIYQGQVDYHLRSSYIGRRMCTNVQNKSRFMYTSAVRQ